MLNFPPRIVVAAIFAVLMVKDVVEGSEILASGLPQGMRVRVARFLRELTQPQTVERMRAPITAAALSQIEAGRVRPALSTLEELSYALDVPVGFFFAQWPDTGTNSSPPPTYFRDLAATPAKRRKRASAYAVLLSDLIAAAEDRVRLPEVRLPDYTLSVDAPVAEMEDVAAAVRDEWNLALDPIPNVVKEIERRGVPVARLLLGFEDVDAFSVGFTRRPVVLLTADKSSYTRSRFDAAHELGHLLSHRHPNDRRRLAEDQAHRFAAALLMPREVAVSELPRRANSSLWPLLAQLKSQWGISMAALLYRAKTLRILPEADYVTAVRYMSTRGWRRTEPGDREMGPPESPLLLERLLRTLETECSVSPLELARSAQLPEDDVLSLIEASTDRRPEVEV
jgi:Zn-dependent peptidase ImmA (M78 family)/transcriptional regulator with XRE-family HTH domain